MTDDRTRQIMGDYLDGRLDDEARAAFDRRLSTEPELSRELTSLRRMREALRSGDEELSPGFYTRTVAQFEAQRHRGLRLPFGMSPTIAGLAAASIVAFAIFIPLVMRDEIRPVPSRPESVTESQTPIARDAKETAVVRDKDRELPSEDAPAEGKAALADDDRTGGRGQTSGAGEERRDAPAKKADRLEESVLAPGKIEEMKPTPAESVDRGAMIRTRQKAAAPPPSVAAEPEAMREVESIEVSDLQAQEFKRRKEVDDSETVVTAPAVGFAGGRGVIAHALADSTLKPGTVELRSAVEPGDFVSDLPGDATAGADEAAPARRLLLIGPRPGLESCAALYVLADKDAWIVRYTESDSETGAVSCMIPLPDDGREVRFLGERIDE